MSVSSAQTRTSPRISPAGLKVIERFEECRLAPYQDVAGIWTYGVGAIRALDGRRVTWATLPLPNEQSALFILSRDTLIASSAIDRLVTVSLAQNQIDALGSWVFNLGEGNLRNSALLRCINWRNEARIAEEWVRWNRAGGVVVKGLTRRREEELALWQS